MRFGLAHIAVDNDFAPTLEQSIHAEELGFDFIGFAEHHGSPYVYPYAIPALAAVATRTRRVRLISTILLLPLFHPVRIAEDGALLDVISGGRLVLGVAAAYAPKEFAAFGVPLSERRQRMEEGVRLIRRLWTEDEVTYEGRGVSLSRFRLFPQPIQKPPPIWIGGIVRASIRRAARLGDAFFMGATPTLGEIHERLAIYREALAERGETLAGKEVPLLRYVFVAKDRAETEEAKRLIVRRFQEEYTGWGMPDVLKNRDMSPEAILRDRIIVGEASACVEDLARYRDAGITLIGACARFPGMSHETTLAGMRRLAERVMPQLA
jgi:alkanesulfonate monooxygenase SsuD/methylene tetrahydromethanopterin reductase-like flavin-dependent oxidoreductase (luciferase family)